MSKRATALTRAFALFVLLAARPASAARATLSSLQSDPHFAAWSAALAAPSEAAPPRAGCDTREALGALELRKHALRQALLESLARRGIEPAPAPAGVAPWPWGFAAGPGPQAAHYDSADVAVLVDDGLLVYTNRVGEPEIDPVHAARAFYSMHDDEYQFLVLFTNFYSQLSGNSFGAYHLGIANDVLGLGYEHVRDDEIFDGSADFTRHAGPGHLQSFVHMNDIRGYPQDPLQIWRNNYSLVTFLGHEVGHRWITRLRLRLGPPGSAATTQLLGRQGVHWSFFYHSSGSVLEGNPWSLAGDRFYTLDLPLGYGPLDLYLMGMLSPSEVPADTLWYVSEPSDFDPPLDPRDLGPFGATSAPLPGVSCSGQRIPFTMSDVVWANGERLPAYPQAPRSFRLAFALATRSPDDVTPAQLDKLARLQRDFRVWFQESTLGRGEVDTHLHRIPGKILFTHRPHGDFEAAQLPIHIECGIRVQQASLPVHLDDVRLDLLYAVDGGASVPIPMQPGPPGAFAADIPPQPLGSSLRYWFRATSNVPGHENRWPAAAPDSAFEFHIALDQSAPVVQSVPRRRWSHFAVPPLVRALVRDAHGVAGVHIEYRLRGELELQSLPLQVQGTSDIWEAPLPLPGHAGDVLEYRIVARDVAATPHVAVLPASGFWALEITRTVNEDAEVEDPMWTHRSLRLEGPDEWHREIVNPHGGAYAWKVGPKNNTAPGVIAARQGAVLEGPALRIGPGSSLTMWHRWAFLLEGMDPRRYAIDGGVVQWQDVPADSALDRWWFIDPDSGYTHVISIESDGELGMNYPVFSGVQTGWVREVFTFWPWMWNRTVRLRFHVATSSPQYRRPALDGWLIDDIEIDPGQVVPVSVEALQAQRTAAGVHLSWVARRPHAGDEFRIYRADSGNEEDGPNAAAAVRAAASGGAAAGTGAEFVLLGRVDADPGISTYSFDDDAARAERAYAYRLAVRSGGAETPVQEARVAAAARLALHANVPNPFNPSTRIRFELPRRERARLAVYDVSGRRVRVLVDAWLEAGGHQVTWDGHDDSGRRAASGIYLYQLSSGGRTQVRRMALLQ